MAGKNTSSDADNTKKKSQSGTKRNVVNGAMSALLVPILDNLVKQVATAVPHDSAARNPTVLRIVDGVLGFLEGQTGNLGIVGGTLAEKGINSLEMLAGYLSGKVDLEKHEKTGFEVKMEPFVAAAQKKILGAKTKEKVQEALVELEAQLDGMLKFAETVRAKTAPQKKPTPEIHEHDAFSKIVNDAAGKGAVHLNNFADWIRRS